MQPKILIRKWHSSLACIQRPRLCAVGELTNCLPGTKAKFITKSRSLELLLGRIPSAETKAWICTADDCFNVMPQLHKTFCYAFVLLSSGSLILFSNFSIVFFAFANLVALFFSTSFTVVHFSNLWCRGTSKAAIQTNASNIKIGE